MPERRTPRELAAAVWRIAKIPGFWKMGLAVCTIATTVCTTVVTTGVHGWQWVVLQREKLETSNRLCEQHVAGERVDRETITARLTNRQDIYEAQLRAIGEEHVRFVAATRKQDVKATVDYYKSLVEHWPCSEKTECMSPAKAVETALKARVEDIRAKIR